MPSLSSILYLPFALIHTIIQGTVPIIATRSQVPTQMTNPTTESEIATIAAGCFWGVENHFLNLKGVVATAVGYTGGHTQNPTYREVCRGDTAHAEAVQITFLPTQITYEQILQHFWHIHDPTQSNRQGLDIGSQYRSAIFYHSPQQQTTAHASKQIAQGKFPQAIVTEITPAATFWLAEDYHQKYVLKKQVS